MSMVIAHNIPALQTYNIVNNTSNALQKSIAKLSSGLRINSAADDAAGLAISEKMRSQVRGLDRAVANTQDGISMIQTAEGALSETHSILQRMRELSVQAANDTLTQQDRSYIQEEVDQLKEEITRIGNTTQFNKKKLLNGDSSALWSSSDIDTKAIINGGLREVDQFGQKKSIEGNYKIKVKADPGQGEVQKSDIMTIKHPNVISNKSINTADGVKDIEIDNMTPGDYTLGLKATTGDLTLANTGGVTKATTAITGSYGVGGDQYVSKFTITGGSTAAGAAGSIVFTYDDDDDTSTTAVELGTIGIASGGSVEASLSATGALNTLNQTAAKYGLTFAYDTTNGLTVSKFGDKPNTVTVAVNNGGYTTAPTIEMGTAEATDVAVGSVVQVASGDNLKLNGSVLFEVLGKDEVNDTVTLKATSLTLSQKGSTSTATMDNILIKGGDTADLSDLFGGSTSNKDGLATLTLSAGYAGAMKDGAKFVAYFGAAAWDGQTVQDTDYTSSAIVMDLSGDIDKNWEDTWEDGVFGGNTLSYLLNADELTNTEVDIKNFILNEKTGTVSQGTIKLITNDAFTSDNLVDYTSKKAATTSPLYKGDTLAAFTSTYIGKTARGDVKLRDLDKFWNSEGTFMLDDAKKLTLSQGNGNTASIMLYANDTLDEVAKKINDAIAVDLGQSKYVDDATKFATFVSADDVSSNSMAVEGTFIIRSVVPGTDGEITFSGDENILNALSLNTIQDSKESTFSVDVSDAHTGKIIAQNVKTTGNVLHGVINENVDVEFGSLSGIQAKWNTSLNKFIYNSETTTSTLHLADNTTVLQIGANEGEDLAMDIGDMRAHSLGLDGVSVMSHERAGRSITIIDNAIDKVSTQRAKLGAYQNRLEYTASNLTTASENLTSAESRIRDADMAKEMMEFTKLNIMLQAGNSMLAQANQQPQNVLSLIR